MRQTKKTSSEHSVGDLVELLMSGWWIILATVLVTVGGCWVWYQRQPLVYYRTSTVMVKDVSSRPSTGGLERFDHSINRINLSNEIRQFHSKTLLDEVVRELGLDIHYLLPGKMRDDDLNSSSPFRVSVEGLKETESLLFDITAADGRSAEVAGLPLSRPEFPNGSEHLKGKPAVRVLFGKPAKIGALTVTVDTTRHFSPRWIGCRVRVLRIPPDEESASLMGRISVRQEDDESSILTISMSDTSPQKCEDVLCTLVDVYNSHSLRDKGIAADRTAAFINARLAVIANELRTVEEQLENFKTENLHFAADESGAASKAEIDRHTAILEEYERRREAVGLLSRILRYDSVAPTILPEVAEPELVDRIALYNTLVFRRKELLLEGGSGNPAIISLDSRLARTGKELKAAADGVTAGLDSRIEEETGRLEEADGRLASFPSYEREILDIRRQQKIKQDLYLFLLNKREENSLSKAMADRNAKFIDPPNGPHGPVAPRRNNFLALGLLTGLLISVGALTMKMYLDTKVHSTDDFREITSARMVGEIPFDRKSSGGLYDSHRKSRGIKSVPQPILAASFRFLHYNLTLAGTAPGSSPAKVVSVISPASGDGKSFVAKNLGATAAKFGIRVAVVDLDFRKRGLSGQMNLLCSPGVTDFITDSSLTASDVATVCGYFDMVPAGKSPCNPASMLLSPRFEELFSQLRCTYDFIIVDNASLRLNNDMSVATRIADVTLYIVRAGKFDVRHISELRVLCEQGVLKNMCIVVNGLSSLRWKRRWKD